MTQLNNLAMDLKHYVTDATQCINSHIETKLKEISEATKTLVNSVKTTISNAPPLSTSNLGSNASLNYRKTLINSAWKSSPVWFLPFWDMNQD